MLLRDPRLRGARVSIGSSSGLARCSAATLNPARLLHATDRFGSVAPGHVADLVILDVDPLADIRNTTRIDAVVADGRLHDRASLDSLLARVERSAGRPAR